MDAIKEKYYPVGNYDDQYMRWNLLHKKRDQTMPEFKNTFHTLRTNMGIKDSERNLVLKYRRSLHRYILIEMEFMGVSSLGYASRYVIKIDQKFKQ